MPSHPRRTVLALSASALLSLAGCASGGRETDESPTTAKTCAGDTTIETITIETTTTGTTGAETTDSESYRYVELFVRSVEANDVAGEVIQQFSDLSERQRRVVSGAVADGAYLLPEEGRSFEPFRTVAFVAYEGDYYRVERAPRTPTVGYNSRYVAERIARTESAARDVVAREVTIRIGASDFRPGARKLLTSLVPGPSRREWENPIPDGVDALLESLRERDRFRGSNRFFVAYCENYYEVRATEAMA